MNKIIEQTFSTWGEFLSQVETGKKNPVFRVTFRGKKVFASERKGRESFTLTETLDEAIQLGFSGWIDGEKTARGISAPLVSKISQKIVRTDVNHDIEGHVIDVARYVEGEPECWMRFEDVITEGQGNRVLKLVFNMTASAGVSSDVMVRKGAYISALVELLEYSGFRVEVILAESCAGGNDYSQTFVTVKEADQNLNMARVIFALAHPSVLRRLHFALQEQYPTNIGKALLTGKTYGRPREIDESQRGDIYIGRSFGRDNQWTTPEKAEAWITEELKRQGIELKEEGLS
jgi:hypothetical protein